MAITTSISISVKADGRTCLDWSTISLAFTQNRNQSLETHVSGVERDRIPKSFLRGICTSVTAYRFSATHVNRFAVPRRTKYCSRGAGDRIGQDIWDGSRYTGACAGMGGTSAVWLSTGVRTRTDHATTGRIRKTRPSGPWARIYLADGRVHHSRQSSGAG